MSRHLLRETGVAHLEHLFSPPGLPLVAKTPAAPASTSVLVRGRAGTGKTTLALSVALAIARHGKGRLLYLSTEIASADVAWKLEQLELPPDHLAPWSAPTPTVEVLVDHLGAIEGAAIEEPTARMSEALRTVWERCAVVLEGAPLRAVVIDAFSLAGAHPDPSMRGTLLELIQALEARGISVVLVEEAGAAAQDWTAFLVDLVLELQWGQDPDNGTMIRKLALTKSRYARSRPGPHDYGMEQENLAVWPPIGPIVAAGELWEKAPFERAELLMPWASRQATVVRGGHLVASHVDVSKTRPASALAGSPWLATPWLRTRSAVSWNEHVLADISEGPDAVAWILIAWGRHGASAIVLSDLDYLLRRERYRAPLRDSLDALISAGFLLVVDSPAGRRDELALAYDFIPGGEGFSRGECIRALLACRGALASAASPPLWNRWLRARPELAGRLGASREAYATRSQPSPLENVLLFSRRGEWGRVRSGASGMLDGASWQATVCSALAGLDEVAIKGCHRIFARDSSVPRPVTLVWAGLHATHTLAEAPLSWLAALTDPDELLLTALFRAPAYARRGRLVEADAEAERLLASHDDPPEWFRARLLASLRLEHPDREVQEPAIATLRQLATDPRLPDVQQVGILGDLLVLYRARGDREHAAAVLAQAKGILPDYDPDLPDEV